MSIRRYLQAALLLSLMPLTAQAIDDDLTELRGNRQLNEWKLVRNDSIHNIRTFAKQEDGKRIRSFRGEVLLDGSLAMVARIHFDIDNIKRWYYETRESRLLKKVSNTEYYFYMRYDAPATLPDRDAILHAVIEPYNSQRGYMQIIMNATPDFMPTAPGLVRMVAQDMVIRLTPQGADKTKLEVEGYMDPGGIAPVWAVNFVQRRAPYLTLVGLSRMTSLPQYRDSNTPTLFKYID